MNTKALLEDMPALVALINSGQSETSKKGWTPKHIYWKEKELIEQEMTQNLLNPKNTILKFTEHNAINRVRVLLVEKELNVLGMAYGFARTSKGYRQKNFWLKPKTTP
ncbi:hypothetical protein ACFFWB_26980 [Flavobacterium procerum]|uniref:hypothetical protein n=1 Tax=Flavobacterium procerum TaxID=1455569 RepID=UPI0035EBC6A1